MTNKKLKMRMIRNIASGVRLSRMTGAMRRAVSSFVTHHSSFFIDLRSSLLTLGKVQASLTLLSLNRSLRHSSFVICHSSLIIALTALAGCSSDSGEEQRPVTPTPEQPEVVEQRTAISFSGSEEEAKEVNAGNTKAHETRAQGTRAETRAGEPLSAKRTSFMVWGYKNMSFGEKGYNGTQTVFPGYTVKWHDGSAASTTTNSSGWEYVAQETGSDPEQTVKYWDWAAVAYRFFAVTNWAGTPPTPPTAYEANKSYGTNGTYGPSDEYGTYEISMLADASSKTEMDNTPFFSHLWFSTDALPTYADKRFGKPVQLEFLKPYARVRFIIRYVYPREGIKLTSLSFKPTDVGDKIARKGTVTVHYPKEGPEIREWYTMDLATGAGSEELDEFTEDYDPENGSKTYTETDEGWYMVMPNNEQGSYTLSVKINSADKTCVVPEQYMQWLPGYSYTYIFKITDEGGVEIGWVEYAVTPWTEMAATWAVYNW